MTRFSGFDVAVVVDVETTGLDPEDARIVSVALLRVKFIELKDNPDRLNCESLQFVVNLGCAIPRAAATAGRGLRGGPRRLPGTARPAARREARDRQPLAPENPDDAVNARAPVPRRGLPGLGGSDQGPTGGRR